MRLNIEMVPKSAWGKNLRTSVKKSDWDKIRRAVYMKQNMHCNICGELCSVLDAHEVWQFDEKKHIQCLADIIGVCKPCHNVIHFGRANFLGEPYISDAIAQFCKVNDCEPIEMKIYLLGVEGKYTELAGIEDWKLDLTLIENQGFKVIVE